MKIRTAVALGAATLGMVATMVSPASALEVKTARTKGSYNGVIVVGVAAAVVDSGGSVTMACEATTAGLPTNTGVGCYLWGQSTHSAYYIPGGVETWTVGPASAVVGTIPASALPAQAYLLCVAAGFDNIKWVATSDCTPII
jgi:hypothetical protein